METAPSTKYMPSARQQTLIDFALAVPCVTRHEWEQQNA